VAALKKSDIRDWLGRNTATWLEENHEGQFKKLESEFLQLARQYTASQPGNWQALFYPLAVYSEVHMARMFVKRDKPKKDKDPNKKPIEDTRFVVEVDVSQMGELQMDGFVRRGENVQFDMVIRSLQPLPDEIQNEILAIYSRTGDVTGYAGQLSFQAVREFPVNPMEEVVKQHMASVIA
jgi:hypothetical protein